ncbi:MAG: TIGR03560 family F420-dependent LLM class oxidoreductase [Candidatus Thorarchaeota archaeon]|nr:TIGR03560 family F420-dependent LLM class oxidoreductase [Candidatus Thorarchaeota archaeon]
MKDQVPFFFRSEVELKIGIQIEPQMGYTYEDIVTLAKASENAGFYSFTVSDHFFGNPESVEKHAHDAWTLLALLTPQTERIRLGVVVTCQSYRNPAQLAKIVATLDNASNGRIDFGIGAGWKRSEYEAYGYPFPSNKTRVLQLREAIQIINLLWTETRPSFDGEYYRIKETMFLPKPVQKPRIPIWIGTQKLKAPMMEEIIARYADGLNYDTETPEELLEKKNRMRKACDKVGRNFNDLKWSLYLCTSVIGKDAHDFEAKKKELLKQHWLFEEITDKQKPNVLEVMLTKYVSGTVDSAVEDLSKYRNEIDILILGLPMVGDLRKNGLYTIKILKDHIVPRT